MGDDGEQNGTTNEKFNLFDYSNSIFNGKVVENNKEKEESINKKNNNYHFSQYNLVPKEIYQDIFDHAKIKSKRNKKKNKKNRLKNYNIRKGDWLCPFCNNINFSFRTECNLCGIKKSYNEDNQDNLKEIIVQ